MFCFSSKVWYSLTERCKDGKNLLVKDLPVEFSSEEVSVICSSLVVLLRLFINTETIQVSKQSRSIQVSRRKPLYRSEILSIVINFNAFFKFKSLYVTSGGGGSMFENVWSG